MLQWFNKKEDSSSATAEGLKDTPLKDDDYEFLFNQLLDGVAHGWHLGRIVKFFELLEPRGTNSGWIAWFQQFETRVVYSNDPAKRRIGAIMMRLGELTQSYDELEEIAAISHRIGKKLYIGNVTELIWEYDGADLVTTAEVTTTTNPPGSESDEESIERSPEVEDISSGTPQETATLENLSVDEPELISTDEPLLELDETTLVEENIENLSVDEPEVVSTTEPPLELDEPVEGAASSDELDEIIDRAFATYEAEDPEPISHHEPAIAETSELSTDEIINRAFEEGLQTHVDRASQEAQPDDDLFKALEAEANNQKQESLSEEELLNRAFEEGLQAQVEAGLVESNESIESLAELTQQLTILQEDSSAEELVSEQAEELFTDSDYTTEQPTVSPDLVPEPEPNVEPRDKDSVRSLAELSEQLTVLQDDLLEETEDEDLTLVAPNRDRADSSSVASFLEAAKALVPGSDGRHNANLSWEEFVTVLEQDETLARAVAQYLNIESNNPQDIVQAAVDRFSRKQETLNPATAELVESWFHLGLKQASAEDFQGAIASWDKALRLNPNLSEAWHNRGSALGRLGKYEAAIQSFNKAINIAPERHQAWNDRAHALYQLQKWEQAIASWDKAIVIMSDNYQFWYNRGCALEHLNRYDESIASYEKALEIKPDFQPARSRYISLVKESSSSTLN